MQWRDIPHFSFPHKFQTKFISTTSQLHVHLGPKPSEATSEGLNLKHFLGETYPQTPQEQCASHDQPSLSETCTLCK